MIHDLCALLRLVDGRNKHPSTAVPDCRTVQSTPESGENTCYDGAKTHKGSKIHAAVDTLGHLLTLHISPASENDRDHVVEMAGSLSDATDGNVKIAWLDQGYTGDHAKSSVAAERVNLVVVKFPEAKRGFVLLPRRWVVERSFAWSSHSRRLARGHERLAGVFASVRLVAFASLMLSRLTLLV